jgi:predicted Zn-dependent protease
MAKLRRTSTPSKPSKSKKMKAKPASRPKAAPAVGKRPAKRVPAAKARLAAKPASKTTPKPAPKGKHTAKKTGKKSAGTKPRVPAKPVRHTKSKVPAKIVAKTPARNTAKAKKVATPQPPPHRSTYIDAVALYERGVQALQAHHYKEAGDLLSSVIVKFPEEKELHERARLYIQICQRQIETPPRVVETTEDKVFSATLAINNGALDQAIMVLSSVVRDDPDHDHATYMLGVTYALKGNHEMALQMLSRSMALNPENHDLARKEPDLEGLRTTDAFKALLASPPPLIQRKDRKARKTR